MPPLPVGSGATECVGAGFIPPLRFTTETPRTPSVNWLIRILLAAEPRVSFGLRHRNPINQQSPDSTLPQALEARRMQSLGRKPQDRSGHTQLRKAPGGGDRWIARGVNSPSAAIRGRCHGGLREGGWLAYGHWLVRASHDALWASVAPDLAHNSYQLRSGDRHPRSGQQQRAVSGADTEIRGSYQAQRQISGAEVRVREGVAVTSGSFKRGK
jgi:hypothetical protein